MARLGAPNRENASKFQLPSIAEVEKAGYFRGKCVVWLTTSGKPLVFWQFHGFPLPSHGDEDMAKAAKGGAKKAAKKALTKSQFVAHLAEKTELSKKQVDAVLTEIVATVTDQLKDAGKFVFPGLARMTLSRVAERK